LELTDLMAVALAVLMAEWTTWRSYVAIKACATNYRLLFSRGKIGKRGERVLRVDRWAVGNPNVVLRTTFLNGYLQKGVSRNFVGPCFLFTDSLPSLLSHSLELHACARGVDDCAADALVYPIHNNQLVKEAKDKHQNTNLFSCHAPTNQPNKSNE
jgi:hypothetical protein